MNGMWYDVGCTMGLTLGHGAWQIDRPSNGSMWNSYNFQSIGQWMGYSFTDLGAEGCCRFLNALLFFSLFLSFLKLIMACRLCVIYVREDNDSSVQAIIIRLIWTIWTSLSAVRERPLNLITHSLEKTSKCQETDCLGFGFWLDNSVLP